MQFIELVSRTGAAVAHSKGLSHGKHCFLELEAARPDLADVIRGTCYDPSKDNRVIPQFWVRVANIW